jgi:Fungal Zn(2)-Cys(6) binuclear cluster domain
MASESPEDSSTERQSPTVCFLCRQRKTKCDRTLPRCGFCIKAKVDCKYVATPKKRGLRAGYVSGLEIRIQYLENEVQAIRSKQTHVNVPTPSLEHVYAQWNNTPAAPTTPSLTPSSWAGSAAKQCRLNPESDAAIRDLMSLPHTYLYSLADLWFKETQPWSPILSQQNIHDALQALPVPVDHIEDIELRALLSLEIAYSTQAICLGYHGRRRLSQYLRSQVLTEAFSKASMSSLRALIIIAFLDYGDDNIPSTFSLLSVCRRTCEHLGLFQRLLNQIEMASPAQVGPPSTGSSSEERNTIAVAWGILALDAVSTLGVPWRDVSAALVDHLSSVAYVSSPDLKDSFRTHVHLAAIGLQPVHTFIHEHARQQPVEVSDEVLGKCDEMYNNLMSYAQAQPPTTYTMLADGVVDFDPNTFHTLVLAHGAVIIFHQALINVEDGSPQVAIARCLQACEDLVLSIRNISDADAELNTPLLANFYFVAARFKLVMYRALSTRREPAFDTLMHGINMCGRRWPVARRLDIVLRAAIMEVDTGQPSSLPADFWDLKQSQLDISERMKDWVAEHKPSLYVGCLNGPYA